MPNARLQALARCLALVVCTHFVVPASIAAGATLTVTTAADNTTTDTLCTLREAILAVNLTPANSDCGIGSGAGDIINFNIPAGPFPHVISPTSPLPTIVKSVDINAYSQPGAGSNTLATGNNAVIGIVLDGTSAGAAANGFTANAPEPAPGNVAVQIVGFNIRKFGGAAILLLSGGHNIAGNFIGTDAAGTTALGNGGGGTSAAIVIHANAGVSQTPTGIGGGTGARNVISGNPNGGIAITVDPTGTVTGFTITDNYIGTNASGTATLANGGPGILVSGSLGNIGASSLPGGICTNGCNLISGNQIGVKFTGTTAGFTGATFAGNFIGTDIAGTTALGNGTGSNIFADGTSGTGTVQLGSTNARNVISGATRWGVEIVNVAAGHFTTSLSTGLIGTDASGNSALPNALGGVRMVNGNLSSVLTATPQLNLISGNGGPGIRMEGNSFANLISVTVGTKADRATALPNNGNGVELVASGANVPVGGLIGDNTHPTYTNVIAFNQGAGVAITAGRQVQVNGPTSIFGNTGLGIDLGPAGVTANDGCDGDSGANDLQNFPVLTAASTDGASTTISGTLNSLASKSFRIDFFANTLLPAQAQTFLGSTPVTTGAGCTAPISVTLPVGVAPGASITATATSTDPALLNTSELAAPVLAAGTVAVSKSFTSPSFARGGTDTLTITITNQSASTTASSVAFTDTYPVGLLNATPSATTNTCGGTLTATAADNKVVLSGGSIPSSSSCTVTVSLTSNTPGFYTNTIPSNGVTTSLGNNGLPASASVTVTGDPSPAKSFSPTSIAVNGTSTVTITIFNTAASAITGVNLTDNLPASLVVAAVPNATNSCGGTFAPAAGATSVSLSGGTVPPAGNCVMTFDVTSSIAGLYTNTINAGDISSSNAGPNLSAASDTLTVLAPPTLTKQFTPASVQIGVSSQLKLTLSNSNASALTNVSVTDNYPANLVNAATPGLSTTCGTPSGTTATAGGSGFSITGATIPANGSCTITLDVTSSIAGSYPNTIAVNGVSNGIAGNTTPVLGTLTVTAPSIGVVKSFPGSPIAVNGTSALQLTLSNPASIPLTGVAFNDTYGGTAVNTGASISTTCGGSVTAANGTNTLTFTGGTIPANGSCTISVEVTSASAGSSTNTIAAGALTSDNGATNGSAASATLATLGVPTVQKSFSPSTIPAGSTSQLAIVIHNPNPSTVSNINLTDTYPTGVVNAATPSLSSNCGGTSSAAAGDNKITLTSGSILGSGTCTMLVTVTASAAGIYTNTIAAGALTSSSGANDTPASATLTVVAAPTITKQFSPATTTVNAPSTLTITLSNPNSVALPSTSFTDAYPSGLVNAATPNASTTCGGTLTATAGGGSLALSGGTIPASGSCMVSVTVTSAASGSYPNSVVAVTSTAGGPLTSNAASDTLVITSAIGVTKQFTPSTINLGSTSQLTINLTNSNATPLTGVNFTDALPTHLAIAPTPNASTTCGGTFTANAGATSLNLSAGTVPAGGCQLTVDVVADSGGTFTNSIAAGAVSSSGGSNAAPATASLNVVGIGAAKSFNPPSVEASVATQLKIVLSNGANVSIGGVAFTDTFPAGLAVAPAPSASNSCGGTFAPNAGDTSLTLSGGTIPAAGTCTLVVDVLSPANGSYPNTIAAGAITASGGATNAAPASATLTVQPALSVTKSFTPSAITAAGTSTLTITITNNTVATQSSVAFTDTYPSGVTNAASPNTSTTCGGTIIANAGTGSLSFSGGTIAPTATCTVAVDVTSSTPGGAINTLAAGAVTSSSASSQSPATATLQVFGVDIAVTKSFTPAIIHVGQITTLKVTLTNPDASPVTGVAFNDTLIGSSPIAAAPNVTNTCGGSVTATPGNALLQLSGGTIPASGNCSVTVDLIGNDNVFFTNTIKAGDVSGSGGGAGNTSAASANLLVGNGIGVDKSFSPAAIVSGGISTLAITLASNNGGTVHGAAFTDNLPSGVVVATPANINSPCGGSVTATPGSGSIIVSGIDVTLATPCTISVDVTSTSLGAHTNTIQAGDVTTLDAGSNELAAQATLNVNGSSDLNVAKSFAPSAIPAGGTSRATITLTNATNAAFPQLSFTDALPAGVVIATTPNAATTCGGTITATAGATSFALANGAVAAFSQCTVAADVTASAAGSYVNTIPAFAIISGSVAANPNPATAALTVFTGIGAAKSFAPSFIPSGGTSTLTITLSNTANTAATNAAFSDTYPGGLVNAATPNVATTCGGTLSAAAGGSSVSLTGATIPANGACTVTVAVTSATPGTYTNTLPAGALTAGAQSSSSAASATLNVLAPPVVSKSFAPSSVGVNGISRLQISLTNPNSVPVTGVAFTDSYPGGVVNAPAPNVASSCGGNVTANAGSGSLALTLGTIPAGTACTVSVDVTGSAPGSFGNTLNAGGVTTTNAGASTNASSATLTILNGLSASKSFNPAIIAKGGTSVLTIRLDNPTASAASGIVFHDDYPAFVTNAAAPNASSTCGGSVTAIPGGTGFTFSAGSLAANSNCTVSITVTSNGPGAHTNSLAAGAVSSSIGGNVAPANATLTTLTEPIVLKDFTPNPMGAGATSRLRITIIDTNLLPDLTPIPINGLAFTDTYPAGLVNAPAPNAASTCGGTVTAAPGGNALTFSGGSDATVQCSVQVDVTSSATGSYVNTLATASVTSANAGANNTPASATLDVVPPLILAKSFTPSEIITGTTSTLTITIANPGASAASNVNLIDFYPTEIVNAAAPNATSSCGGSLNATPGFNEIDLTGAVIPAGQTCTITTLVTGSTSGTFTNTLPASFVDASNAAGGNDASASLQLFAQPAFAKQFSQPQILLGSTVQLTITLTNTDASPVAGVSFTDAYPAGLVNAATPNASSTCGGTVTAAPGGSSLTLTGATMPAAGNCTVTVTLLGTAPGTWTNTIPAMGFTVAGRGVNAATVNASVTVVGQPAVTKSFSPPSIVLGSSATLTITLSNPNAQAITGVAFTDNYPSGLVNDASPGAATTCGGAVTATAGGASLALSGGTIPANGSCTVTVLVTAAAPGSFTNTIPAGGVTTANAGASTGAASGAFNVALLNPPAVAKAFAPTTIDTINSQSVLTVTLTNPNVATAITGVAFTDNYPTGMTNAVAPNASTDCGGTLTAIAGGTSLSLSGGTIAPGGSCTVTVTITAASGTSFVNTIPAGTVASANAAANAVAATATLTRSTAAIPALSPLALFAFALMLAGAALVALRMQ